MTASLPSASLLAKLPLRSTVAYASRAARRVLTIHPVGYAEICEDALHVVNEFVRFSSGDRDLAQRAAFAAAAIAGAEAIDETGRNLRVGLATRAAACCCHYAVNAVTGPEVEQDFCLDRVGREAARAARQMDKASSEFAVADYELLIKLFGQRVSALLGDPFDPSEQGPLGPLFG
jgi:hypothetical protein